MVLNAHHNCANNSLVNLTAKIASTQSQRRKTMSPAARRFMSPFRTFLLRPV